ncbi:MAG: putative transposase [Glaciecola sp.]|jgi:putative transposase
MYACYRYAHHIIMPIVNYSTEQYENKFCELSHQPTRQQERQMRWFKSQGYANSIS